MNFQKGKFISEIESLEELWKEPQEGKKSLSRYFYIGRLVTTFLRSQNEWHYNDSQYFKDER